MYSIWAAAPCARSPPLPLVSINHHHHHHQHDERVLSEPYANYACLLHARRPTTMLPAQRFLLHWYTKETKQRNSGTRPGQSSCMFRYCLDQRDKHAAGTKWKANKHKVNEEKKCCNVLSRTFGETFIPSVLAYRSPVRYHSFRGTPEGMATAYIKDGCCAIISFAPLNTRARIAFALLSAILSVCLPHEHKALCLNVIRPTPDNDVQYILGGVVRSRA